MGVGIIAAVFLLITLVLLIAWAIARRHDGVEFQVESFLQTSLFACGCITVLFGLIAVIVDAANHATQIQQERTREMFDEGAADAEVGLPYNNRYNGESRKQYRDGYLSKKK